MSASKHQKEIPYIFRDLHFNPFKKTERCHSSDDHRSAIQGHDHKLLLDRLREIAFSRLTVYRNASVIVLIYG